MSNIVIFTIACLTIIGLVLAVILYLVSQKFKVEEDPRIEQVESLLPGANCGGCGYAGCHAFADAAVKDTSLDGHFCPVGGNEVMAKIAEALGQEAKEQKKMVAVVRCNGSLENRARTSTFDGFKSCRVISSLYGGETDCKYGCAGYGDCVKACQFGAISINPQTGLPEVDQTKCTGCGACAKACPKALIELRFAGPKDRRVCVVCRNQDKGAVARKACKAACIGCGKCEKVCPFGAVKVENNLAYVDFNLCKLCKKCVDACPTGAIHAVNFPVKPAPAAAPAAPETTQAPAQAAPAPAAQPVTENKEA